MARERKPNSFSAVDRINLRIAEHIARRTDGLQAVCRQCGQPFSQVWIPERSCYSQHTLCPSCRLQSLKFEAKAELHYDPHPGQRLFHESDARFRLLACGARWGKDRCCAMEYIRRFTEMLSENRDPSMVPAVHGWIIAPTYILARQGWREFKNFFPREWVVNYWESDLMVETVNDGLIEVRSADNPDTLVGVGLDIVWITEAARIARLDEVWANIELRLMSPGRGPRGEGGIALINSTPKGGNMFERMFHWGQKGDPEYDPEWESWRFSSWENPYLTARDQKALERIRRRFPERIYRQEVLAEFLPEGNSVFPSAADCATYAGPEEPEPGETYVIGYDPAQIVDHSGVAVRNSRGETVLIEQWTGRSWTQQFDTIAWLSRLYGGALVVVDVTGLGQTIPEELAKRGVQVEAVAFTNPEKERLVNNLALLIEQKSISYPRHDVLLAELKDYQYSITRSGLIRYSSSTQYKHDDLVTALMLAYKDFNSPDLDLPWMGMVASVGGRRKGALRVVA